MVRLPEIEGGGNVEKRRDRESEAARACMHEKVRWKTSPQTNTSFVHNRSESSAASSSSPCCSGVSKPSGTSSDAATNPLLYHNNNSSNSNSKDNADTSPSRFPTFTARKNPSRLHTPLLLVRFLRVHCRRRRSRLPGIRRLPKRTLHMNFSKCRGGGTGERCPKGSG
jgi:hypothetical protein